MLMQAQPVYDACAAVKERIAMRRAKEGSPIPDAAGEKGELPRLRVIYVTPQGTVFTPQMAGEIAREEDLIFLCGHYEGIDERVLEERCVEETGVRYPDKRLLSPIREK